MFEAFQDLCERLDRANLRVRRPKHSVFLCGGLIGGEGTVTALSLRDYLYRLKKIEAKIDADFILAEKAQQLYRDTGYKDLISFEEDIAQAASIVLVISESPGSLAELGAFASEPAIRNTLRVIISEKFNLAESFARHGPIKRVENSNRAYVGVFPWRINTSGKKIVKSSANPHIREIIRFVQDRLDELPKTLSYDKLGEKAKIFYDILWILSLFDLSPPEPLYKSVSLIHPGVSEATLRDILYALKVCKWIDSFSYSGKDYYFLPRNTDPVEYSFKYGKRIRDMSAQKMKISAEFVHHTGISKPIRRRLHEIRGAGS